MSRKAAATLNAWTTCQLCPAQILFVQMVRNDGVFGKVAPVDLMASPNGNIRVVQSFHCVEGRVLPKTELEHAKANELPLHVSHFVTCPEAKQFGARRTP
jgi:hypothetical protein